MLLKLHLEAACLSLDLNAAAGKSIVDGSFERFPVAKDANCLESGRQIGALVVEHWRECPNLGNANWRRGVGAESLVESPAANGLTHGEHLRRTLRISNCGEHAVGRA